MSGLTPEMIVALESRRSHYGCGADSCTDCYPIQYACDYCGEQLGPPVANGDYYQCEECGWSKGDEK